VATRGGEPGASVANRMAVSRYVVLTPASADQSEFLLSEKLVARCARH
jgi:hypothetical protein